MDVKKVTFCILVDHAEPTPLVVITFEGADGRRKTVHKKLTYAPITVTPDEEPEDAIR